MMYSLKLLILHKGSYIKNFIKRCNSRGNDPLNVFDSSSWTSIFTYQAVTILSLRTTYRQSLLISGQKRRVCAEEQKRKGTQEVSEWRFLKKEGQSEK
jgi:hypothetical protein